ncbi:MAG: helix-turn-helix transcriptional regulator [Pararhodobacter sp.]|nr:helix-turn-helix transcriptional regulator [Pararhodobacter sp.]
MSGMHDLEPGQHSLIGRHLIELLVGGLKWTHQVPESDISSVQAAHLRRIKAVVRQRLQEPDLSVVDIADACGLSVRYVHRLFSATGTSMRRWITGQRLLECDGLLRNPRTRLSLAMIAQQYGFCDQSHFNKLYKRRFGRTPGETRAEARRTVSDD